MIDLENKFFKRMLSVFEESFVNSQNEFIASLKFYPSDKLSYYELLLARASRPRPVFVNAYFRLEDCKDELDLKRKIIEWLSRSCCKSQYSKKYDKYIHEYFRVRCNELLNVKFTEDDWEKIYTYLGNGVNSKLCIEFINSNYNMNLLERIKSE